MSGEIDKIRLSETHFGSGSSANVVKNCFFEGSYTFIRMGIKSLELERLIGYDFGR